MKEVICFICVCVTFVQSSLAQWALTDAQKRQITELDNQTNLPSQMAEQYRMLIYVNHGNAAFRLAVADRMISEANAVANILQLPIGHPIQVADIRDFHTGFPWQDLIHTSYPPHTGYFSYMPETVYTTNIFDVTIPRERRLDALKFGVAGYLETTNFDFSFDQGHIQHIMRISKSHTEYLANNLDSLVGIKSLIDTNGAYQIATQWLQAISVDVSALEKQFPHTVNQLSYRSRGATNSVLLPIFYVGLGTNVSPKLKPTSFDPAVEVEILGTTKELQDLEIHDPSVFHRPLLLVSNALDLVRAPDPSSKRLQATTK